MQKNQSKPTSIHHENDENVSNGTVLYQDRQPMFKIQLEDFQTGE